MANETSIVIRVRDTGSRTLRKVSDNLAVMARRVTQAAIKSLSAKANLDSLKKIMGAISGRAVRVGRAFRNMARATGFLRSKLSTLRNAMASVLAVIGTIVFAIGGFIAAGALLWQGLRGMQGALEDAATGGESAAGGLDDAGEAAEGAGKEISGAAAASTKAAQQVKAAFGAFGDVGAGFVQRQGRVSEGVEDMADSAVSAAADAGDAVDDLEGSVGEATGSVTQFGKALDRIGAAGKAAMLVILQAIAEALAPALEALADLMESPEFQEFVKLLAKDLANAVRVLATWFIQKAIPAISRFLKKVNEAGGPIEFVKSKFTELSRTAAKVLGIIVVRAIRWKRDLFGLFSSVGNFAIAVWERIRDGAADLWGEITRIWNGIGDDIGGAIESAKVAIDTTLDNIKTSFSVLKDDIMSAFGAVQEAIGQVDISAIFTGATTAAKTAINGMLGVLEGGLNRIISGVNRFIRTVNKMALALGLNGLPELSNISIPRLAKGGIVDRPTFAMLGDGGPEAVAPLPDLAQAIAQAVGGAGGGAGVTIENVNIYASTNDPDALARQFGIAVNRELRRQGRRLPA